MAKSRRVTFEVPPASQRVLEQAAQENGINVQAAASLILQAALARRISGLVPKRPAKARAGGGATADSAAPGATDSGRSAVAGAVSSPGPSQGSEGEEANG